MDITKKETYFYHLPHELIAQTPAEPRDSSRLLVYNRSNKAVEHKHFYDLVNYLKKGDVLLVNNTKVIPARLYGKKQETGANVEVFLLKRHNLTEWEALVKPAKRLKVGSVVVFSGDLSCTVVGDGDYGKKIINFEYSGVFEDILARVGNVPLPHYIKQDNYKNLERYNTIYSKTDGSSAAPTAGLHFTNELFEMLKAKGVEVVEVLLHVGLGTFRPVSEENILNHEMHSEFLHLSEEAAEVINGAKREGRRVVAVGTTSVRVLESCADENGFVVPQIKQTNIFIYPSYKFKIVDALITNFHLPESTLIMLVSAFCGVEETLNFYRIAVQEKYRFFSFGDAMLLI